MSINETYMDFITLIKNNKLEEVKLFLENEKININIRPTLYDKITINYAENSNFKMLQYLLEEKNGDVLAFLNTNQLNQYIKGVEVLIKKGINAEKLYENSFVYACSHGALDIAKHVINKNINIYAHQNLALKLACQNNQLATVKYLIDKKFKITEESLLLSSKIVSGLSVFNMPIYERNYDVCQYLIENYKFKDINLFSEQVIENLNKDFYPANQEMYQKMYEMMEKLILTHRIELTKKMKDLLTGEFKS